MVRMDSRCEVRKEHVDRVAVEVKLGVLKEDACNLGRSMTKGYY